MRIVPHMRGAVGETHGGEIYWQCPTPNAQCPLPNDLHRIAPTLLPSDAATPSTLSTLHKDPMGGGKLIDHVKKYGGRMQATIGIAIIANTRAPRRTRKLLPAY